MIVKPGGSLIQMVVWLKRGLIIFHLFVSYTKLIWRQPVLQPSVDDDNYNLITFFSFDRSVLLPNKVVAFWQVIKQKLVMHWNCFTLVVNLQRFVHHETLFSNFFVNVYRFSRILAYQFWWISFDECIHCLRPTWDYETKNHYKLFSTIENLTKGSKPGSMDP